MWMMSSRPVERIVILLNSIHDWREMPANYLKGIYDLLDAGEDIVALENLIENLYEFDIEIPPQAGMELNALAKSRSLQPRYLEILAQLSKG